MEQKRSLSIPYHQHRWMFGLMGLPMAAGGFWMCFLFFYSFAGESFGLILLMLPMPLCGAAMGLLGLKAVVESLLMVHFVTEGIAVTLFGKALRLYPAENLRLCCQSRGPNFHWIAVSCLDMEQLAKRREQRLRRSWIYKSSVDSKMRHPGWQALFAREQIRAESRKAVVNPLGRDIFWMEFTPERRGFLRGMYPQLPWLGVEENANTPLYPWKDKNEYVFCRGRCNSGGKLGMAFVCSIFVVPIFVIALLMPKEPGSDFPLVLWAGVCMAVLFGTLWHFGKRDYDEFWVYPDRLRITRGNRDLETIPAEEVRTVFRGSWYHKGGRMEYLAVSRMTEAEIARKIEETCRSREKRVMLRACRQLPNSDRLVIAWCAARWMSAGVYRMPYSQNFFHTPRREEVLRERYPNAVWIDLESF